MMETYGMARRKKRLALRIADPRTLFFLALLLAGIIITVLAAVQSTRPINFASCNDSGCANVKN